MLITKTVWLEVEAESGRQAREELEMADIDELDALAMDQDQDWEVEVGGAMESEDY